VAELIEVASSQIETYVPIYNRVTSGVEWAALDENTYLNPPKSKTETQLVFSFPNSSSKARPPSFSFGLVRMVSRQKRRDHSFRQSEILKGKTLGNFF
jgi:hypothetical protein